MKKSLLLLFIPFLIFLLPFSLKGQADTSGIQHGKIYELKLRAPVKCIQHIEYDNTGNEPNWKLSEDNKVIYIQDYIINTKVKLKVVYDTGREEEYTQSPCSIRLSEKQPAL